MDNDPYPGWKEVLERPIWDCLNDVYKHAGLSSEEMKALDQYSQISEYFLLRAKRPMVIGMNQGPSLVRRLAGYLRFFNSDAVCGLNNNPPPPRKTWLEGAFKDKPIHKFTTRSVKQTLDNGDIKEGQGFRSSAQSTIFWDKLAELEVLTFFCANGYKVKLPNRKMQGPKPEFFIQVNGAMLGAEVKNLNVDALLDNIFGDFDHTISLMQSNVSESEACAEMPEDYGKIVGTIRNQYDAAAKKFYDKPGLVCIYVPTRRSNLFEDFDNYVCKLFSSWDGGKDSQVAGLVCAFDGSVEFLQNPKHLKLTKELRFERVNLQSLGKVYECCAELDLWPRD